MGPRPREINGFMDCLLSYGSRPNFKTSIPEQLWIGGIKGIYRLHKSKDFPNPASSGNGYIALYDTSFSGTANLLQILVHECVHVYYDSLSEEEKLAYRIATGWAVRQEHGREVPVIRRKSGFVRPGCAINVNEDFACNVELFLTDPEKLKTSEPAAHGWIRNHFGDSFRIRK